MIRRKVVADRLFYTADEVVRPSRVSRYSRLNSAVGNWSEIAAPLMDAFSRERNGRPTDPIVYLKIFIVGHIENIRDDTDLAERISDSLSIRLFLGYGLDELTPDHSSISRVRARLDGYMEPVLARVVDLCCEAGLVDGGECSVDSSLAKANASKASLRHLDTGKTPRDHLSKVREQDPGAELKVRNSEFGSTSDPDARLATKPSAPSDLYYKITHVTDSKAQVILAAGCGRADVHDPVCALDPLKRAKKSLVRSGKTLGLVVADGTYDEGQFHSQVESLGGVPITSTYRRRPKTQIPKSDFRFDEADDVYTCPAGQRLSRVRTSAERNQYRSKAKICQDCPFKTDCIGEGKTRTISRMPHEEVRSRCLANSRSRRGRVALSRRKHVVEPTFAYMKERAGMRRLNCRRLGKVNVKAHTFAITWNLLKLAAGASAKLKPMARSNTRNGHIRL